MESLLEMELCYFRVVECALSKTRMEVHYLFFLSLVKASKFKNLNVL